MNIDGADIVFSIALIAVMVIATVAFTASSNIAIAELNLEAAKIQCEAE